MKGKLCDNCGNFTLILVKGIRRCTECGVVRCNEWGGNCPYGLLEMDQETCIACWSDRLNGIPHSERGENTMGVPPPILPSPHTAKGGTEYARIPIPDSDPSLTVTDSGSTIREPDADPGLSYQSQLGRERSSHRGIMPPTFFPDRPLTPKPPSQEVVK